MLKKYPAAEYAEGPGMRPAPVGLCQNVLYETSQRVFTRCACARRTGFLIKFLIKNQYQETLWMAEPFHAAWNASPRDSLTVGWGNTVWTSSSALASASMAEAARAIISVVWTPYR